MNRVVVALGSNIEPEINLPAAIDRLSREFGVKARSVIVVTSPLGGIVQADFHNGVVLLLTELEQAPLAIRLKELEVILGRQPRNDKWGPREIDLDVLIWNGKVVNKDFYERDFLRQAVAEILPDLNLRCY